jgi:hypothetical protein
MEQALRNCRRAESAFSTFQSAMRSAVELYWGFSFAQTGWDKRRNSPRVISGAGLFSVDTHISRKARTAR